jgi:glycosyltransferase involved in cell wall biosynthesis
MNKVVTIALPAYKNMTYLPEALRCVDRQDYRDIELIVSDNGMNGGLVKEIADQNYSRPYRFRQNPQTVSCSEHWNQIIDEATGEYFMMLCDDDEITPNYVSEMVHFLESHSEAGAVFSRQEIIDTAGRIIGTSRDNLPQLMSCDDWVRAWCHYELGFKTWVTHLAKTDEIRNCGRYPLFGRGTANDDALLLKLCLERSVGFCTTCTFRNRKYETSFGLSEDCRQLAVDYAEFFKFLDNDPQLVDFARQYPQRWAATRSYLEKLSWEVYFARWGWLYRNRLSTAEWIRVAFAMPYIPGYYRAVIAKLVRDAKAYALSPVKRSLPGVYKTYARLRYGKPSDEVDDDLIART